MLEMLDIGIDNAVAFKVSAKVSKDDMEHVLAEVRHKIANYGEIVIFEEVESFDGVEMAALILEFKYWFEFGLTHIDRVAVVTDKQWIQQIVNLEEKLIKKFDVHCFASDQREAAIAYLQGD